MIVFLDGRWLDESEARVPIDDRGFLYADGVFETARLHGGAYFRLDSHLGRLAAGAEVFGLPLPGPDELRRLAEEIRERNGLEEGSLRITVTRGRGTADATPTLLVTLKPIAADWRERGSRGWTLITARVRHPDPASLPPHVKTIGRPHGILARREAEQARVDDALLLSPEGYVAEGPTWNVFWRKGETLFTPSLEAGVLDGVTRAAFLELAPRAGLRVEQGCWPRDTLDDADELFATMSSLGAVAIRALDGTAFDPRRMSAVALLRERYWALVEGEASVSRRPGAGAAGTEHAS